MSVDSPVQVDLDSLSEASLINLKKVYAVMSAFLEENITVDSLDTTDVSYVLSSFNEVKIRDGVLKYFTSLPKELRLDVLKNVTMYVDHAARNNVDNQIICESTGYLAALMVLHAAFKVEIGEFIDEEMEIITGLIKDSNRIGEPTSLIQMLDMAVIRHNIPTTVFKDSVEAVSLEECVKVK